MESKILASNKSAKRDFEILKYLGLGVEILKALFFFGLNALNGLIKIN